MDHAKSANKPTPGIGSAPRQGYSAEASEDESMRPTAQRSHALADRLQRGPAPVRNEAERVPTQQSAVSVARSLQEVDRSQLVRDRVMAKVADRSRQIDGNRREIAKPVENTRNIDSLAEPRAERVAGQPDLPPVGRKEHDRARDLISQAADPKNIAVLKAAQERLSKHAQTEPGVTPAHAVAAVTIVAEQSRDPELRGKAAEFLASKGERGAEVIDRLAKDGDLDGVARLDRKMQAERALANLQARAAAHRQAQMQGMMRN
jgi:hypothetical protein